MSPSRKSKRRKYLVACAWILSIILAAIGAYFLGRYAERATGYLERAYVTRVIDGDTIELQGGRRVRYIGIDTPETVDPRKPVQCFGPDASERNRQLVEGKTVELLRGIEDMDEYGRLLRYVFVDGIFVNAELVTEGYARQYGFGPENRFQQVFVQLEQYSISKHRGLWAACPHEEN